MFTDIKHLTTWPPHYRVTLRICGGAMILYKNIMACFLNLLLNYTVILAVLHLNKFNSFDPCHTLGFFLFKEALTLNTLDKLYFDHIFLLNKHLFLNKLSIFFQKLKLYLRGFVGSTIFLYVIPTTTIYCITFWVFRPHLSSLHFLLPSVSQQVT